LPDTGSLAQLTDVLSLTDHRPGAWGYGKIHAQMVPGPCGEVYVATYWGTNEGLTFSASYQGDRLFRIDPASDTIADLGTPVPEHGLPSLAGQPTAPARGRPDPLRRGLQGPFFVMTYETETVFQDGDAAVGFRNIAADAEGGSSPPGALRA
jgi:hypothetical protein